MSEPVQAHPGGLRGAGQSAAAAQPALRAEHLPALRRHQVRRLRPGARLRPEQARIRGSAKLIRAGTVGQRAALAEVGPLPDRTGLSAHAEGVERLFRDTERAAAPRPRPKVRPALAQTAAQTTLLAQLLTPQVPVAPLQKQHGADPHLLAKVHQPKQHPPKHEQK